MATPLKLKEEFLTCIICHEVFRDPVTLHCGHTFCTQCVTAYTKTQQHAIAEKSIPCPHCRGLTKVPDPTRMVDDWAGQFNTGFFVKGLVEAVVTDKQGEDVCTPCQAGGETTPAVFWCCDCGDALCSGCEKVHRRLQSTKHHEVISLSNQGNSHVTKSRKRFTCPKHPDAVIDMMCEDCDVAVCHRCCILHHRKCESVITLEDCRPKLMSVLESHEKELGNVVKEVKEELSALTSRLKAVEEDAEDAISTVNAGSEKIMSEVRSQQSQLIERVRQAKDQVTQNLIADIKSGEMRHEEAKQRQGLIKEAFESDITINHYEMYKICKSTGAGNREEPAQRKDQIQIQIDDNSAVIVSHIRNQPFAILNMCGQNTSSEAIGPVSKPTLLKKMDTGIKNIWDILVMTVNGTKAVIVTSWSENSVTSFYQRRGKQCHSCLTALGSIRNITKISKDMCAVAVTGKKQIDFVLVTPDLQRDSTITMDREYLGLTCLNSSTLVASTGYPKGQVDIIAMSGAVLKSLEVPHYAAHLTSISASDIIIPDFDTHCVKRVTNTGEIKFRYPQVSDEKLRMPRGVSHSRHGEVFVAYEASNRVIQLTSTGQYVRDVLSVTDGVKVPVALFVDDDNMMYVSVNHDTIYVYEFQ